MTKARQNGDGSLSIEWSAIVKAIVVAIVALLAGGLLRVIALDIEVKLNGQRLDALAKLVEKHGEWDERMTAEIIRQIDELGHAEHDRP